MKGGSFLITISVGLAASIGLGGASAYAAGPAGVTVSVGGPIIAPAMPGPRAAQRIVQDKIVPHGFFSLPSPPHRGGFGGPHHRRFPRGGFVPFGVFSSPVVIVTPPADSYGSSDNYGDPGYYGQAYDQSPAYNPPVVYTQPMDAPIAASPRVPPAPPAPDVVQYDTGRYELRGDGMTTPYTWVWIPNPPPPPPSGPPTGLPMAPRFSGDPSPGRQSHLYRWTDDQGVVHLTDRLEAVPPQYRVQAKQTPPS